MSSSGKNGGGTPHLKRVLGRWDLVLLFVVAVANLNVVPVVAASGAVVVWLWLLALLLFFWPQGVAVIELSHRYPHEGGVYLWTKEVFGDFHGFLSGWSYWTNNVFYIPTLLFYIVGISVYVGGPHVQAFGNSKLFVFAMSVALLLVMLGLNILGLGVGKWLNNLGGLGTFITAGVLVSLSLILLRIGGNTIRASDLSLAGVDWHLLSSFGVICFGLVGLELASVMGDEIRDPERTVPTAVLWGGVFSGLLYVGATLAVLLALPAAKIGAVQGILQAVTRMASQIGMLWLVPPLALVLALAITGTTSAWFSGSARIPFVAGLDNYLPAALGKLHPRFATPYVALTVHAILSCVFVAMSFVGATVEEAYKTLLLLAVVLQLLPFLYMYAALGRIAVSRRYSPGRYTRPVLFLAGLSGLLSTLAGMFVAFLPQESGEPTWLFEFKMAAGTIFFIGLGAFFYFFYSRRSRPAAEALASPAESREGVP